MHIVIEIPEDEIPKHQAIIEIPLHFVDGKICEAGGYGFDVLPKGHGDLIDRSKIYKAIPAEEDNCTGMGMTYEEMNAYNEGIDAMYMSVKWAKPIIEADKEESEDKE